MPAIDPRRCPNPVHRKRQNRRSWSRGCRSREKTRSVMGSSRGVVRSGAATVMVVAGGMVMMRLKGGGAWAYRRRPHARRHAFVPVRRDAGRQSRLTRAERDSEPACLRDWHEPRRDQSAEQQCRQHQQCQPGPTLSEFGEVQNHGAKSTSKPLQLPWTLRSPPFRARNNYFLGPEFHPAAGQNA